MDAVYDTSLLVNNTGIDLNEFAHQYVTKIVLCAVSMLKGGTDVKDLVYTLEGEKTGLTINAKAIPLSPFPRDALRETFKGVALSLRGVDKINSLKIEMKLRQESPDGA
jgi:hypothetical protein